MCLFISGLDAPAVQESSNLWFWWVKSTVLRLVNWTIVASAMEEQVPGPGHPGLRSHAGPVKDGRRHCRQYLRTPRQGRTGVIRVLPQPG